LESKKNQYWDSVYKKSKKDGSGYLWRSHSDAVNIDLVDRWLPLGTTGRLLKTDLFDEAMGEGIYPFLKAKAQNVLGIDLSSLIVNGALKRHNYLKGTIADVQHLPFKDNIFDIIVSISTLDHFKTSDEIANSLGELHRVLRVGGLLIITLDNLANPIIALRNILPFRLLNSLGIVPYFVGATFGPHRLNVILKQIGFDLLKTTAIMHCPRLLAVALAQRLERCDTAKTQRRFLRALMSFERLSHWPTRFLTGNFVAVKAIKR